MDDEAKRIEAVKFRTRLKRAGSRRMLRRVLRRLRLWRIPPDSIGAFEFLLAAGIAGFVRVVPMFLGLLFSRNVLVFFLVVEAILFLDVMRRLLRARHASRFTTVFIPLMMVGMSYGGFFAPLKKANAVLEARRNPPRPAVRLFVVLSDEGFKKGSVVYLTNDWFKVEKQKLVDEREIRAAVKLPMSQWKTNGGMLRLGVENSSGQLFMTNLEVQLMVKASTNYAISEDWKRAVSASTFVHEYWLQETPIIWPKASAVLPPLYFTKLSEGPFMVVASARATKLPPDTLAFYYWFSPDVMEPNVVRLQFANGGFKEIR